MPVGDLGERGAEIDFRVHAVELGGLHDSVYRRRSVAAGIGTGEEVILAPERDSAHGILGDVVVDLEPRVCDEAAERPAALDRVAERFAMPAPQAGQEKARFAPPAERLAHRTATVLVLPVPGASTRTGVSLATADLPSDPEALRAFALACQAERGQGGCRRLSCAGGGGATVLRQSIASMRSANCAGVSVRLPSIIGGQTKRPFSSRLAKRQSPVPSQ